MSVNSGILGMQGPNLSEPCASPQVQPMHSEAKMVSNSFHHPSAVLWLSLLTCALTPAWQRSQVGGSVFAVVNSPVCGKAVQGLRLAFLEVFVTDPWRRIVG